MSYYLLIAGAGEFLIMSLAIGYFAKRPRSPQITFRVGNGPP